MMQGELTNGSVIDDSPLKDSILYDDADLTVEARLCGSRMVFFTFSEMMHRPENGAWGREVFRKLGVSYVGFIAKRPNWFPAPSMRRAAAAITLFLPHDRITVGYGHSQGGYATVRYARLLGLDHALSFCPQYSIDPKDTHGFDPRYGGYFAGSAEHRAISPEDVGPETTVHLLYDPWFALDKGHVDRILGVAPWARVYPAFATGHNTIRMLASTRAMAELIEVLSEGGNALHPLFTKLRHRLAFRRDILAQYASERHPRRCLALLDSLNAPLFLPECLGPDGIARNLLSHGMCSEVVARREQFGDGPFERRSVIQALLALGEIGEAEKFFRADPQGLRALREVDPEFVELAKNQLAGVEEISTASPQIAFGRGWHGQEDWGRWCSAYTGALTIMPASDGDHRLHMVVSAFRPDRQRIDIRITQDGKTYIHENVAPGPFSLRFSGHLEVGVCVDQLLSPFGIGQADDKRLLGASVIQPSIEPIPH